MIKRLIFPQYNSLGEPTIQLLPINSGLIKQASAKLLPELREKIAKLEKDIAENKFKYGETYRDATPAGLLLMNLQLKNLKKQLELDMPMRDLRFKVAQIRFAQEQPDAPHKNIKKLEKEVRVS